MWVACPAAHAELTSESSRQPSGGPARPDRRTALPWWTRWPRWRRGGAASRPGCECTASLLCVECPPCSAPPLLPPPAAPHQLGACTGRAAQPPRVRTPLPSPSRGLEVGSGSGYVICSLALLLQQLGAAAQLFATDLNAAAAAATRETLAAHQVGSQPVRALRQRAGRLVIQLRGFAGDCGRLMRGGLEEGVAARPEVATRWPLGSCSPDLAPASRRAKPVACLLCSAGVKRRRATHGPCLSAAATAGGPGGPPGKCRRLPAVPAAPAVHATPGAWGGWELGAAAGGRASLGPAAARCQRGGSHALVLGPSGANLLGWPGPAPLCARRSSTPLMCPRRMRKWAAAASQVRRGARPFCAAPHCRTSRGQAQSLQPRLWGAGLVPAGTGRRAARPGTAGTALGGALDHGAAPLLQRRGRAATGGGG